MKIAIFGIGFLGNKLMEFFSKEHKVIGADINPKNNFIKKIDATNKKEVEDFLIQNKPEIVIDTIALTSSVKCEKNLELCKKLNYETAKNIADACKKINSKMIFISSSYVFNGEKGNYKETDQPKTTNEYAKTKLLAENEVLKNPTSIVIRIEPMYGFDSLTNQLKFGTGTFAKEVEIGYPDMLRKPLFIEDVPNIILKLIKKNQKGIFNVAGPDKLKWIDFLKKLALLINAQDKIKIVDSSKWVIKSPNDSSLEISKINSLGIKTTSFKDALEKLQKFLNH